VWKTRDHDYVLSEREKQLGYLLMCSNTAVSDLVIEAAEASGVGDLPLQQIRASVRRLERLGEDLLVLHVQTPRTQTLRFLAGQRATLTVAGDLSAGHPIASCPCDGRHLEFHIRRVPGDPFARAVFEDLRPGEMVTVTGPQGEFVLRDDSARAAVFIAFDDGFAPIKSLIQHALSIDLAQSFRLYWVVSRDDGHYLDNLCRSWRDALENFQYTPLRLGPSPGPDEVERALERVLADMPALDGCEVYVTGPAASMTSAAAVLRARGVASEMLRMEVVVPRPGP
jgi:CDP-4-dehydro-6-deoxyglucose reductase